MNNRKQIFNLCRSHQRELAAIIKKYKQIQKIRTKNPNEYQKQYDILALAIGEFIKKYNAFYEFNLNHFIPTDYFLTYCSREFRYFHIAYCELRGRTRDEIEKSPYSLANTARVEKVKDRIIALIYSIDKND